MGPGHSAVANPLSQLIGPTYLLFFIERMRNSLIYLPRIFFFEILVSTLEKLLEASALILCCIIAVRLLKYLFDVALFPPFTFRFVVAQINIQTADTA